MNVNIGGTKGWKNVAEEIRDRWTVFDSSPNAPIEHDLNSGGVFPLEDYSVDNYYASHVLEHVNTFQIPFVMSEIYRTLKPGGKIRIVVPDIAVGMRMYINDEELRKSPYCTPDPALPPTLLGALMGWWQGRDRGKSQYYSGHATCFDAETLGYYLHQVGFPRVDIMEYGISSTIFEGLDQGRYKDWCLFIETIKE